MNVLPGSLCQTSEGQITLWFTVVSTDLWVAGESSVCTVCGYALLYDMYHNTIEFMEEHCGYSYVLRDGDGLLL